MPYCPVFCTISCGLKTPLFCPHGYTYANETGLYYLQSRYYDPEVGRFITADAFASTGQGILGNNMFAYCLNNPANGSDPCGTCFHRLDFWNDCEKCGGKSIGDKWKNVTTWCADIYSTINNAYQQQIETQAEITKMQNKLVHDAVAAAWNVHVQSVMLQMQAQHEQNMTIIKAAEILSADRLLAIDVAMGALGLGSGYIGVVATITGASFPVVGQVILGVAGVVSSLWGIARLGVTILERMRE